MFGLMSGSARGAARAESIAALRRLAARRLPKVVFDFIDGAAGDETTRRDNEAAFLEWLLLPRVAVDVSRRMLQTSIVGRQSALPLLLSPVGLSGFFWPGGEIAPRRVSLERIRRRVRECLAGRAGNSRRQRASGIPDTTRV